MCSVPVTEGTVCVYFGDVSFTRISLYPRANRTCRETCSSGVRAKLILHGMFARMPNKQWWGHLNDTKTTILCKNALRKYFVIHISPVSPPLKTSNDLLTLGLHLVSSANQPETKLPFSWTLYQLHRNQQSSDPQIFFESSSVSKVKATWEWLQSIKITIIILLLKNTINTIDAKNHETYYFFFCKTTLPSFAQI